MNRRSLPTSDSLEKSDEGSDQGRTHNPEAANPAQTLVQITYREPETVKATVEYSPEQLAPLRAASSSAGNTPYDRCIAALVRSAPDAVGIVETMLGGLALDPMTLSMADLATAAPLIETRCRKLLGLDESAAVARALRDVIMT